MKAIIPCIASFCALFLFSLDLSAKIKLPSVFGNNMVLQQQTNALIWGQAEPGKSVEITTSWDKQVYHAKVEKDGKWEIRVATPSAGGPYEIRLSEENVIILQNVLIGEVWICSGQSNMDMRMEGKPNQPVLSANEAITNSTNRSIRFFTTSINSSIEPLDDLTGQWKECIPETVAKSSAAAYYFGKMLQEVLDVPIGLICSCYGGSRIEPWIGKSGFDKLVLSDYFDKDQEIHAQKSPSLLFNALIHPLVGFDIKGVVWYQGESNVDKPQQYETLLSSLIQNWREEWDIGNFPFYIAQIAPYDFRQSQVNSAYLREAQFKVSRSVPNSGMACLLDVGEKNCPHPANKKVVGERLAYWALAKTYNIRGIEYSGPVLKEMSVNGNTVDLVFDHAPLGLTTYGKELVNFKVAGEDKQFHSAKAQITNSGIRLSSPDVSSPIAVRYAFDDFVIGELYNTIGLPASSFRTDNW